MVVSAVFTFRLRHSRTQGRGVRTEESIRSAPELAPGNTPPGLPVLAHEGKDVWGHGKIIANGLGGYYYYYYHYYYLLSNEPFAYGHLLAQGMSAQPRGRTWSGVHNPVYVL